MRSPRSTTWKSDTTMNTSEIDRLTLAEETPRASNSVPPGAGFPASGLPDPLLLARMANEFFAAPPGGFAVNSVLGAGSVPAAAPAGLNALAAPPATVPAVAPEVSLPSDPHVQSAPASAGGVSANPLTVPVQAGPPVVPGALGSAPQDTSSDSSMPAFSFLQDARPIVSDLHTSPQPPYPLARPIADFAPAVADASASPESPTHAPAAAPIAPGIAQPPSPTVPSTLGVVDSSAMPAFSFLEEARPLFSYPPQIPGPVPAFSGADLLPIDAESLRLVPEEPAAGPSDGPETAFGFLRDTRSLKSPESPQPTALPGNEPDVPHELNLSSFPFDAASLKRDFPILRERVNGRELVWLDNAATTQSHQGCFRP
jgi:cysteine desulfurase / selenocysteine lyase